MYPVTSRILLSADERVMRTCVATGPAITNGKMTAALVGALLDSW